jgi:hypothetical protein
MRGRSQWIYRKLYMDMIQSTYIVSQEQYPTNSYITHTLFSMVSMERDVNAAWECAINQEAINISTLIDNTSNNYRVAVGKTIR